MGMFTLNPLALRVPLESIVCYFHTFENNFGIKRIFTNYLKQSFCLPSDQPFPFKCFQENAFESKILPKLSGLFNMAAASVNGLLWRLFV